MAILKENSPHFVAPSASPGSYHRIMDMLVAEKGPELQKQQSGETEKKRLGGRSQRPPRFGGGFCSDRGPRKTAWRWAGG